MAIATTIIRKNELLGGMRLVIGKSVLSGSTATGDVNTTLKLCYAIFPNVYGSTVSGWSVNETLPCDGSAVTVYCTTNDSTIYWVAIGV